MQRLHDQSFKNARMTESPEESLLQRHGKNLHITCYALLCQGYLRLYVDLHVRRRKTCTEIYYTHFHIHTQIRISNFSVGELQGYNVASTDAPIVGNTLDNVSSFYEKEEIRKK